MKALARQNQGEPAMKLLASPQARQQNLDVAIRKQAGRGWKMVTRTETQAQMVFGRSPSHVLHLLLSIVTVGFWIPVWILVGLFGGEKVQLLMVDEYGHVRGLAMTLTEVVDALRELAAEVEKGWPPTSGVFETWATELKRIADALDERYPAKD